MPNQNFSGPHDDMNVVNCDFTKSYNSCEPTEKFCRFAYANWCPVCDVDSHRRRSKSECIESHYRKRGRDMKTPSPKKTDIRAGPKEFLEFHDLRLESSRVRTNLCELPTSYINNCQANVPSNIYNTPYAAKFSNLAEPFYEDRSHPVYSSEVSHKKIVSSVRMGDVQLNGCCKYHYAPQHKLDVPAEITVTQNTSPDSKISYVKHNLVLDGQMALKGAHGSTVIRANDTDVSIKKQIIHAVKHYPAEHAKNNAAGPKEEHTVAAGADYNKLSTVGTRRCLPTPATPRSAAKQLDTTQTSTGKKQPQVPSAPQDKHCTDVCASPPTSAPQVLESKRNRVRQRSDSDNSYDAPSEKQIEPCKVIAKKAREVSPLENKRDARTKSAVKVASIKNRHKLSAIKLRKVRSKIAHSISSDSNFSDSDYSESEDEEKDESETGETNGDASGDKCIERTNGSTPMSSCVSAAVPEADEQEKWPIRPSLFPHIPPYIQFSSHDAEVFKVPPGVARFLKWKLSTITPVVVRKTLTNSGFRLVRSEYPKESNDWIGTWGKHIKSVCFQSLKDTQKLNHFPGTFQIGRKDRLWKNLQRLMFKYGHKEFGFIPRTFVLPHDLKLLRQAWEKTGNEKWIIKPPASARGTGIKVIHRWAHLPKKKSLVVQQYISNPYLINGSKFDLRLYVLVTSFNPLRIYLYPDGLARFASTKYSDDLSTLSDRYMHLTNYSINKLSSQYTANEDANACKGHKWTLSKLWEYLEKDGVDTKALWRSLQQLVIKTILCGESSISQLYKANVNSRYNCYELFGVDVLLDERLKPWLLEVNISPSLHSASPLDLHVKGPLVQTLLNLAQFHLPPKLGRIRTSPPCLNQSLYSTQLSTKERLKHIHFTEFEKREEYISDILKDLTGDDIRHLTQAEDELTAAANFERIFPTKHTHYYLQFMDTRYYNRLFDAWETRYEKNRPAGIKLLQSLCEKKLHLEVPPSPVNKNSSSETGQESSPEVSTSDESVQLPLPILPRPQTCPIPTNNVLRTGVRYRMMKLQIDSGTSRPITPF